MIYRLFLFDFLWTWFELDFFELDFLFEVGFEAVGCCAIDGGAVEFDPAREDFAKW